MAKNARLVNAGNGLLVPPGTIILTVWIDLTLSYEEMIKLGHYVNEEEALKLVTEERFPIIRNAAVQQYWTTVLLIPPYRSQIHIREQKEEMVADGFTHGSAVHTLAIGAQYPLFQLAYAIVGTGSLWRDPDRDPRSPGLFSDDGQRELYLSWCDPESELDELVRLVAAPQAVT